MIDANGGFEGRGSWVTVVTEQPSGVADEILMQSL